MRLAQIESGVVTNVIEVQPGAVPDWAADWPEAGDAGPGWAYAGGVFSPPMVAAIVPESMTFAQMLIGLVAEGWITEAEGEAWLTGTVPTAVSTLIGQLPEGQRFAARARAVRPSTVLRNDPLVLGLAALEGKTDGQMDAFFTTYSAV